MDNNFITPQQKTGLLIGSIFAAGLNAATGKNSREAIINAAMGGTKAYTGGMEQLYNIETQKLNQERVRDLINANKFSQAILAGEQIQKQKDRAIEEQRKTQYETTVMSSNLPSIVQEAYMAAKPAQGLSYLLPQLARPEQKPKKPKNLREESFAAYRTGKKTRDQHLATLKEIAEASRVSKSPKETKDKLSTTAYTIADKWIPPVDKYTGLTPERIKLTNRKELVGRLAIEINKDPTLAKDSTRIMEKVQSLMSKPKTSSEDTTLSPDVQQKWNPFDWGGRYDVTKEEKEFIDLFNSLSPERKEAATNDPKFIPLIQKFKRFLK